MRVLFKWTNVRHTNYINFLLCTITVDMKSISCVLCTNLHICPFSLFFPHYFKWQSLYTERSSITQWNENSFRNVNVSIITPDVILQSLLVIRLQVGNRSHLNTWMSSFSSSYVTSSSSIDDLFVLHQIDAFNLILNASEVSHTNPKGLNWISKIFQNEVYESARNVNKF